MLTQAQRIEFMFATGAFSDIAGQYIATNEVDMEQAMGVGLFSAGTTGLFDLVASRIQVHDARAQGESGENVVYVSKNADGVTQYVGITNNLARRQAEHLARKGIEIELLMNNLSRADARSVEQAIIELHGLKKDGGTLINIKETLMQKNCIEA